MSERERETVTIVDCNLCSKLLLKSLAVYFHKHFQSILFGTECLTTAERERERGRDLKKWLIIALDTVIKLRMAQSRFFRDITLSIGREFCTTLISKI